VDVDGNYLADISWICGRGEMNNSAVLDYNSTDQAVIYVKCELVVHNIADWVYMWIFLYVDQIKNLHSSTKRKL